MSSTMVSTSASSEFPGLLPTAGLLATERGARRAALGPRIAILQQIQKELQSLCGLAFGYEVSLGTLLLLAGARPGLGGPLPPSLQEVDVQALLRVLHPAEVEGALSGLLTQFVEETSLDAVINAFILEYSTLEYLLRADEKGRRVQS